MASKKIKGITIEIGADPTGLDKALKGIETRADKAKSNLRDVNTALKAAPNSLTLWHQKQQILTTAIEESRKKLQLLEDAQEQVNKQFAEGKISQDQFFAFEREMEFARAETNKFESQLTEVNDRLKKTAEEAEGAADAIEDFGEKTRSALDEATSELEEIDRAIRKAPESTVLWAQKQQILCVAIEESRNKIKLLEEEQIRLNEQLAKGEITQKQYNAAIREIEVEKGRLSEFESELEKVNDRFTRTADDAKEAAGAIEDVGEEAETAGDKAENSGGGFTVLKGAVADLAADGIRMAIDGFKELALEGETALDSLQAKTGATADQMAEYEDIISDLYGKGMGENKTDLADSIAEVKQQLGDIDADALSEVSENALVLRDTFGFEIAENVRAANMLMQKFGITADEAYNLIAQGAQNGLNKNGDLMDVINEYGVHYSQLGYSAEEFFNSLYNGAATGVFSVDKLGDAMKEFGIRTKDTAESTNEGFALLGLNADTMRSKFAAGGESAKQATQETITALFAMSDKVKQNQAGVALFGTMWEDLGADAVKALTDTTGAADKTASTLEEIGEIKYDNLETNLERVSRKAKDELLEPVVEELLPLVEDGVDFLIDSIPKVANTLEPITGLLKPILSVAGDIFSVAMDGLELLGDGIGAFGDLLGDQTIKMTTFGSETRKQLESDIEALAGVREQAQETADAQLYEVDATKRLWEELQTLADASGNVKEKDWERAQYIMGELQTATGIEMEMIDGQIQKYKDICTEIDNYISKKKASTLLSAYESTYVEGVKAANEAQSEYLTEKKKLDELVAAGPDGTDMESVFEHDAKIKEQQAIVDALYQKYSDAVDMKDPYLEAEQAFAEGRYDEVDDILAYEQDANAEAAADWNRSLDEREQSFHSYCDEVRNALSLANRKNSADSQQTAVEGLTKIVSLSEEYGYSAGELFSAEFRAELQKAMDAGINFDSFIVAAAEAGWDIGSLLGQSAVQRYQEILAENLRIETQQLYANNNLIVKSINSPGDAALHAAGSYIPKHATGGFLHQGEAIVAEAGPELIRIMQGGVQVTPLTATARNHAVEGSTGQRVFYNQITVNATVNSDVDIQKIGQKLAAQLHASEKGAGR